MNKPTDHHLPKVGERRFAMAVEYDGQRYHGWQRQRSVDSVQQRLEKALSVVANHPVEVTCAGRTDRGVHATSQVLHFDSAAVREAHGWQMGAMSNLPADITPLWVRPVADTFHARFSATRRFYRYVVLNRTARPALQRKRMTWWYQPLDVARMQQAAPALLGTHDFTSLRGKDCQAHSPVRELQQLEIHQHGALIYFDLCANAFLHHMVRNIVGTLFEVGMGKRAVDSLPAVLAARDRDAAGITAPADGLYLTGVEYPQALLSCQPVWPQF